MKERAPGEEKKKKRRESQMDDGEQGRSHIRTGKVDGCRDG